MSFIREFKLTVLLCSFYLLRNKFPNSMPDHNAVEQPVKKTNKKNLLKDKQQQALKLTPSSNRTSIVLRWFFYTSLKLSLAVILGLVIYTIYLDGKVQQKFEGQRWKIPLQVFGKPKILSKNQIVNLTDLANSLQLSGYKKVSQITQSGQYAQSKHRLIFNRRAFDFGLGVEPSVVITVDEHDGKISQLTVHSAPIKKVQLEPVLVARIVSANKEDRVIESLENVPEKLIDTLLLVEDRNFYFHAGVSPLGIIRALIANISAGHTVQGGSTLTQQLVKNMFLSRERTITRKINEAIMALILEHRYSKDQLLEAYINEVYLGQNGANGIYGFGLASEFYFDKSLTQLSDGQMALLIAQVKGPSYYDPWRHPKRALKRRDLVLRLMFEKHFINRVEFEMAAESPLSIRKHRRIVKKAHPAYVQQVKRELQKILAQLPSEVNAQSGLRVFTGFSARSQQLLENTVSAQLTALEQQHNTSKLEAAMIVSDIASGEIRAIVADRKATFAGFNRALDAKRPIGSLVKPAIYLAALERYQQYNLATPLADKALKLKSGSGEVWQPKNYDGKYRGQVSLLTALVKSLNVPTVNLGLDLGLDKVADALYSLGYQEDLMLRPSLLLGAINMSPFEVSQLYSAIADHGNYHTQHAVVSVYANNGDLLWKNTPKIEQRLSDSGSYLLNYALHKVTEQGTAKSLTWRLPQHQLSGKTGTTNQLRDSWFVGYDAKHLVTTWVGRDDNQPTKLTGSSGALVLFAEFMKKQGVVDAPLVMPEGVAMLAFEQKSGNAVNAQCAETTDYPAVKVGVVIQNNCLKKQTKKDKRSWFERLFGR